MLQRPDIAPWQGCRYPLSSARGHYESYFIRANDRLSPRALWLRYTLFRPANQADAAVGELWALYFDARHSDSVAPQVRGVRQAFPLQQCSFDRDRVDMRIGSAAITLGSAQGEASSDQHQFLWDLQWAARDNGLLLLPAELYRAPLPKAKSLVLSTHLDISGRLQLDDETLDFEHWTGTLNHNWGSRHTDAYAWGQVCGFDNAPDAFLECASARLRLGRVWSPQLTPVVLRLDGQTHALNGLSTALRNTASYAPWQWRWEAGDDDIRIEGQLHAPSTCFAALHYGNPPGGNKICLNSKIAYCELLVRRKGRSPRRLVSEHGAAFEILTDTLPEGMHPLNAPVV
ncbi:MAG: hypothetical protein LPK85_14065 [Gammaproteobacteria bacterium]|nr:hypothetical protein [Gammaproteobacteria bacterium]